jgi:antitoxin FitA
MASITIRDLPDQTKESLRVRAAQAGVSLEAYARQVLQEASQTRRPKFTGLFELSREFFGGDKGVELQLPPRNTNRPTVAFEP